MRDSFQVVVYNPLPHPRTAHLSLPVTFARAEVVDAATGAAVAAEVFVYRDRNELAILLPMCPLCTYVLRVTKAADTGSPSVKVSQDLSVLENEFLRVTFDDSTGRIAAIFNKEENVDLSVDQNYFW